MEHQQTLERIQKFAPDKSSLKRQSTVRSTKRLQFHPDHASTSAEDYQVPETTLSYEAEEQVPQEGQVVLSFAEDGEGGGEAEAEEVPSDFDPYHGIGQSRAVQYPVEMVFKLMDSQRFVQPGATVREEWMCLLGGAVVTALLGVVLIFSATLLIMHLRAQPRPPVLEIMETWMGTPYLFKVKPGAIQAQQQEGKGNYFAYRLDFVAYLVLNVTNVNKQVDLTIDSLESYLLFSGVPMCMDRLEMFHLPSSKSVYPAVLMYAIGLPLQLKVGYSLKPKIKLPFGIHIDLVVEFYARMRMYLFPGARGCSFNMRYHCDLRLDLENFSYVKHFSCKIVHGSTPNTDHLPVYRQPGWPVNYAELLSIGMPWPDEYSDPNINYAVQPGGMAYVYN